MNKYLNITGKSGIKGYELGNDYIDIVFNSGKVYRYSYQSAGVSNIEQMKMLAQKGKGLNSYIMHNVRTKYESIR